MPKYHVLVTPEVTASSEAQAKYFIIQWLKKNGVYAEVQDVVEID